MLKQLAFAGVLSAIAVTAIGPPSGATRDASISAAMCSPSSGTTVILAHGSDQQMNGFRLDRRADALRGGGQTNIGPGKC